MGKSKKEYVIISGFDIHDNNRGTAALGYGSVSFLVQNHKLTSNTNIFTFRFTKKPWIANMIEKSDTIKYNGNNYIVKTIRVHLIEKWLLQTFGILLTFTNFGKAYKYAKYIAVINGGDGFSDIYGTRAFKKRLPETLLAIKARLPVVFLPQTIGPFKEDANLKLAEYILKRADRVFVRDENFVNEMKQMNIKFNLCNDLSAYMEPLPFNIAIKPDSIGLNISGLVYSNRFHDLSGQFDNYPLLCERIVELFQKYDKDIYLISHSYNYRNPEPYNDDLLASRHFFNRLVKKDGVHLIDQDLISPQIKYIISKMSFFIGTRMHANFAAIFTRVPVFGLAYSSKYEGAFNMNDLEGQTAMINNISELQIDYIIKQIENVYNFYLKKY